MSLLIDELKKEHGSILDVLDEIKEVDMASPEVWEKFKSIQLGLIEHLQKEDEFIYPVLREAASDRVELRRLLDSVDEDMAAITTKVQDFFEKYPTEATGPQFKEEVDELIATLRNRILNVENLLFIEYELLHE
ncbi:MAG: hemerythrin domain-containing protein [Proteobacteria bacterium]|nr:hemerythrin domain-containing protein [Pseudomonadota bacterium]